MKINKLNKKYVLIKALGYKFVMYKHKDENNNDCCTLTVANKWFKIKEHVLLTNPTYVATMFYGKIRDYMFNVIEQSINLIIDSLGLTDILYIERCKSGFNVHKADSVLYEPVFLTYFENYDKLYSDLEDIVTNYKNYF